MELLAANPSQVISTDRFMEKIWGYDSDADVGVVWVYISYLRKRLTAVGATVKIKGRARSGYYHWRYSHDTRFKKKIYSGGNAVNDAGTCCNHGSRQYQQLQGDAEMCR